MTFDIKKAIAGAVSGLLAAVIVDLHAWAQSSDKFDWGLALKRWFVGLVSGFVGAFGVSAIGEL